MYLLRRDVILDGSHGRSFRRHVSCIPIATSQFPLVSSLRDPAILLFRRSPTIGNVSRVESLRTKTSRRSLVGLATRLGCHFWKRFLDLGDDDDDDAAAGVLPTF